MLQYFFILIELCCSNCQERFPLDLLTALIDFSLPLSLLLKPGLPEHPAIKDNNVHLTKHRSPSRSSRSEIGFSHFQHLSVTTTTQRQSHNMHKDFHWSPARQSLPAQRGCYWVTRAVRTGAAGAAGMSREHNPAASSNKRTQWYDLFSVALIAPRYLAVAHSEEFRTAQVPDCESASEVCSAGERLAIQTDAILLHLCKNQTERWLPGMPGASSAAERRSSLVFFRATGNVQNMAFWFLLHSVWVVLNASHHCPGLESRAEICVLPLVSK